MKISWLGEIQAEVRRYVNALALMVGAEAVVTDAALTRIAGTGVFAAEVGKEATQADAACAHILKTGKKAVINKPGEHVLCLDCAVRTGCGKTYEIAAPVLMEDEVIGVIGLIGVNKRQKSQLQAHSAVYLEYLEQSAFLIGKAAQVKSMEWNRAAQSARVPGPKARDIKGIDDILGQSPQIQQLKQTIRKTANAISAVLLTGESGTGKSVVASAIWRAGNRKDKPFLTVNCSATQDAVLEQELFGWGDAGTETRQGGKFVLADGGILFLDEIDGLPPQVQAKLVAAMKSGQVKRSGGDWETAADVRVIAASSRDLREMVRQKKFREDLYYRLNVIPIHVVPLREHPQDIEALFRHFSEYYAVRFQKQILHVDPRALQSLARYEWPGNIRELKNMAEYMVSMMDDDGILRQELLGSELRGGFEEDQQRPVIPLRELERREIERAVTLCGVTTAGKREAARRLGISVATLYRKLEEFEAME